MLRSCLLLAFLLTLGICGKAQDIDKMPSVTVSGSADVMIQPDEVIFSLDFTKLDKDLQTARKLNDDSVSKMLELTRRYNILAGNVKTDNISVEMKYTSIRDPKKRIFDEDGDEIGTKIFKGYQVSKTVIVKLNDIAKFEEFFGEILKTGITEVNSIKFETSKLRENKDKARDMAMKAAREKAVALAAAIGQTIGKAVRITDGISSSPVYPNYSANAMANTTRNNTDTVPISESVATFAPGAIKVTSDVTVVFLLN